MCGTSTGPLELPPQSGSNASRYVYPLPTPCVAAERGYKFFGLNRGEKDGVQGIWYREWAPACQALCLVGEFNDWEPKDNHWAERNDFGVFTLFLPDVDGKPAIQHRTKVSSRPSFPKALSIAHAPIILAWVHRLLACSTTPPFPPPKPPAGPQCGVAKLGTGTELVCVGR